MISHLSDKYFLLALSNIFVGVRRVESRMVGRMLLRQLRPANGRLLHKLQLRDAAETAGACRRGLAACRGWTIGCCCSSISPAVLQFLLCITTQNYREIQTFPVPQSWQNSLLLEYLGFCAKSLNIFWRWISFLLNCEWMFYAAEYFM